jgi:anti-sigma-K factor RskA
LNCQELQDLILPYAADALETSERRTVEAHLASGCPRCAGDLAQAQALLARLPLALNSVTASANAKQRIFNQIDATTNPITDALDSGVLTIPPSAGGVSLLKLVVSSAIAASIAIFVAFALNHQYNKQQSLRIATLQGLIDERQKVVDQQQKSVEQQQYEMKLLNKKINTTTQFIALLQQPDVKSVPLQGQAQNSATARLYWSPSTNKCCLVASGLQPLDIKKTYELWFIPPGKDPIPAGVFDADPQGRGALEFDLPKDLAPTVIAAITDEPSGGRPKPTGQIQIKGEFR